jgi:hypothetical protein
MGRNMVNSPPHLNPGAICRFDGEGSFFADAEAQVKPYVDIPKNKAAC